MSIQTFRQWYKLSCPQGHIFRELTPEDGRFLATDKASFKVKTPCPVCGMEMRLDFGRREEIIY